jgi:hypothetical protein
MTISKIIITDVIMTGSLFSEDGYDASRSGENLAALKGQIIIDYLESRYPGVEICADIAIQEAKGGGRPLEVLAYSENNENIRSESAELQEQLSQKIAEGTAGYSWAVKIDQA